MHRRLSKFWQRFSSLILFCGARMQIFSRKHPFIFTEIIMVGISIIATVISILVGR